MVGLDPNGIPKNKAGLLAASFLSGTFGAAFMLLLAWNASNIAGHSKKVGLPAPMPLNPSQILAKLANTG